MPTARYFLPLALATAALGGYSTVNLHTNLAIAQAQEPSPSPQTEPEPPENEPVAVNTSGFVPPNRGSAQRTVGLGSRGCEFEEDVVAEISALSPSDHVGQTVSARPTFAWHLLNADDVPVTFKLVKPGDKQPLYEVTLPNQPQGFAELTIPAEAPALEPGQKYRWSVEATCDPNNPSSNPFVTINTIRVEPSTELSDRLANATTPREEALAYAQSGIWYDALSTLSNAAEADTSHERDRQALLSDVGIDLSP